jgi:hypothetical protein
MNFKPGECVQGTKSKTKMIVKSINHDPRKESLYSVGNKSGPLKAVYICTWKDDRGKEHERNFDEDEVTGCEE